MDYTEDFEEFWRLYPLKKAKGAAFDSWRKKLSEKDRRECLEHLPERIIADVQWLEGKFVPLPATFLNQRRFEDHYKKAPLFSPRQQEKQDNWCSNCKSIKITQRHQDICIDHLPYYDFAIVNRKWQLRADGAFEFENYGM